MCVEEGWPGGLGMLGDGVGMWARAGGVLSDCRLVAGSVGVMELRLRLWWVVLYYWDDELSRCRV